MDWTAEEGSENRTVEIAVIKVPATVPVTDSRYGGAVILNPGECCFRKKVPIDWSLTYLLGGPGGSGVNLVHHRNSMQENSG